MTLIFSVLGHAFQSIVATLNKQIKILLFNAIPYYVSEFLDTAFQTVLLPVGLKRPLVVLGTWL